jgi:hypothetical protein
MLIIGDAIYDSQISVTVSNAHLRDVSPRIAVILAPGFLPDRHLDHGALARAEGCGKIAQQMMRVVRRTDA